MKRIEAIIDPAKLNEVRRASFEARVEGLSGDVPRGG
jgi:nitrogen regulatory protein PII